MEDVTVKSVTTDDDGNIAVVADLAGHIDHTIVLEPAAIANRMVGYGLATEAEALDAIMREHALRLSDLQPKSDERVDQLGGLDDRITVELTAKAVDEATVTLAEHAAAITTAIEERREPEPLGPESAPDATT